MPEHDALTVDLGDGFRLLAAGVRRERSGKLTADLMLNNGRLLYVDRATLNTVDGAQAWATIVTGPDRPSADRLAKAIFEQVLPEAFALLQEQPAKHPTQADDLVRIVEDLATDAATACELFHDRNSEPYATLPVGTHRETHPLRSRGFRQWLARRYHEQRGKTPNAQALADAINVLAGKALFDGPERAVWVRLALADDALYLDLGDADWHAVEITATGTWKIVGSDEVPIKFRPPVGLLPLPLPDPNGSLSTLDGFLNVADPDDLLLIIGWLIGVFQPTGGRPILELNGEQGSAKTTTARLLRRIVDPCTVPLRTVPREERDLIIAASNGAIVALDNLSDIKDWLSDAFCRLSTGGGLGGRQLYTDLDEIVLDVQRPVLLTGINPANGRGDRLDRTITVTLPPVKPADRRTEAELWRAFESAHPCLLGGVLTAVAGALAQREMVTLEDKPRLADFVAWVEAAAPALGWERGDFLAAFLASRRDADSMAIEALPIGPAIIKVMEDRDTWDGTASDLLVTLNDAVEDSTRRDHDWPKRANRLSNQLRRLAPNLRQIGITVTLARSGHSRTRQITLIKNSEVFDRPHRPQSPEQPETGRCDAPVGVDDADDWDRPRSATADDADDADDGVQDFSGSVCRMCAAPLLPGVRDLCADCDQHLVGVW